MQTSLKVLYRDDSFIAVDKPSGMLVHRGWDDDPITAADILRDALVGDRVFAIHRLDRATSGVLLFALNAAGARYMQQQMQGELVRKHYLALVRGPMKQEIVLDHPVPHRQGEHRVDAITEFHPLAHKDRWSLVRAVPRTGRLHQIRRHLKHLSHPIVGDVRYGKGDVNRFFRENFGLNRLALHATSLEFTRPEGQVIQVSAPLPDDLLEPLEKLGMWLPS